MFEVYLKAGRDKPVRMGHPWIFSGAISKVGGTGENGGQCRVFSHNGECLALGYYNPQSAINLRILSHHNEKFDSDTLKFRIARAVSARKAILDNETDSCRLVNSEGDFLPGLIVDKYSSGLVIQILTAGMELFRNSIIDILNQELSPAFIYERSDTDARKREGLAESSGILTGKVPENLLLSENGLKFRADVESGQKTGFFFDQRQNRNLLKRYALDRRMCDCFCYSGAFSVNALSAGVKSVDLVDISRPALRWAEQNVLENGFSKEKVNFISSDIFKYLRESDRKYDLIVLDPPKFARHPGELRTACRGYKDINLIAIKKIEPAGIIFTFSCSNAVDPKLFRQIAFSAASDAGRQVQVLHVLSSGPDHPVNIAHKEGEYLKGLVLKVLE
jgi:23S rRNA (cytosine1962-C5)-methyltransferase